MGIPTKLCFLLIKDHINTNLCLLDYSMPLKPFYPYELKIYLDARLVSQCLFGWYFGLFWDLTGISNIPEKGFWEN